MRSDRVPLSAFDEALQLTRRLWSADDRQSNELRARHLQAVLFSSPWTLGATLLNVLLCVWVLRPHIGGIGLDIWALTLTLWSSMGLFGWWRGRKRSVQRVRPKVVRHATWNAAALALTWGLLPAIWWPDLAPPHQLFVALLVVGNLSGGAIALAPLPSAAWAFAGLQMASGWVALQRTGGEVGLSIQLLLLLYTTVLCVASYAVARLLAKRHLSEESAAQQGEVIGLLLRDFEESSADVLWEIDVQGRFMNPSERLAELLQRSPDKLARLGLVNALASLQAPGAGGVDRLRQTLVRGEAFRDEVIRVRFAPAAGEPERTRWWSVTAKPVFDHEGRAQGWRGVISDVTAERKSHQHLNYLAHFDSLTGLANRVSVRNRLAQLVEQAAGAEGRRGALLCLDLDNFKNINDSLGHSVGDAVLQEMGKRLRKLMRKSDLCGRLGGDEFALVLDDLRSTDEALQLAQRLVAAMRVPVELSGLQVASGVSIGLALVPEHACSVDEAMAAADLALYAAKAEGRGRVHLFTAELGSSQRRRLDLERELREALVRDQLRVVYQAQVDLKTWRITGAEALVRWHHPQLGPISPAEFVPLAEKTGLIHNIGAWVLDRACSDAGGSLQGLCIAVNVSTAQVQRASFVNELRAQLGRHRLRPGQLEVEITESLLMENVNEALQNLHAIKQLGVRVALDDFGTGYSSLAYLRLFPFDKLKIDRAFVSELMQASDARAIVRAMLELARVLGMSTLAEGVEEPAQLEVLTRVGCSAIQGYLTARPMPASELAALIARWDGLPRPAVTEPLPSSIQGELNEALRGR